jgi:hypothetical protein
VNEVRENATPSTDPYHAASRELEDLAERVYDYARNEKRAAEADAAECEPREDGGGRPPPS